MRHGRKGSALIEFAVVLVPLLAVVFGSIEMDRMLLTYTSVANAARAGVRFAVVHGCYFDGTYNSSPSCPVNSTTQTNIQNVAKTFASMALLDQSTVIVPTANMYPDGNTNIGSRVSVTVSAPYTPFTTFFPFNVTLKSTAEGMICF